MLRSLVNQLRHFLPGIQKVFLFFTVLITGIGIGYFLHLPEIPIRFTPLPENNRIHLMIDESAITIQQNDHWNIQGKKQETGYALSSPIHLFIEGAEVTLTKSVGAKNPVNQPTTKNELSSTTSASKFVASKNGTKYYYTSCSSVSRIKPENLVSFSSEDEAKRAGYEPSSCITSQSSTPP